MRLRWQIGDRNTTRVFLDPWIPRPLSFMEVSRPTVLNEDWYVSDLLKSSSLGLLGWNVDLLKSNVMDMDVEVIRGIPVSQFGGDGRLISHDDGKCCYTVKSGCHRAGQERLLSNRSSGSADTKWWKFLWHLKIPNNVKIFVWRAFHDILPCWSNLANRGIGVQKGCRRCPNAEKTSFHALNIGCDAGSRVWSLTVFWDLISCAFSEG